MIVYPHFYDYPNSHEKTRALGIPVPEVITQISIKSKENGGHFDLAKTGGLIPNWAKEDMLENGAVILSTRQIMIYEYLNGKDFGYPTTINTEDTAGRVAVIIKVKQKLELKLK